MDGTEGIKVQFQTILLNADQGKRHKYTSYHYSVYSLQSTVYSLQCVLFAFPRLSESAPIIQYVEQDIDG